MRGKRDGMGQAGTSVPNDRAAYLMNRGFEKLTRRVLHTGRLPRSAGEHFPLSTSVYLATRWPVRRSSFPSVKIERTTYRLVLAFNTCPSFHSHLTYSHMRAPLITRLIIFIALVILVFVVVNSQIHRPGLSLLITFILVTLYLSIGLSNNNK